MFNTTSKYFSFFKNKLPASQVVYITRDFLICYSCSLHSVLFHPLLRYFKESSLPSRKSILPSSKQPTFLGLNRYQKEKFPSSTVTFYQKSILIFKIPLQIGYRNSWHIFSFIFRQLKMNVCHKIMVTEKNHFSSNS